MGKNKLKKFSDMESMECVFQYPFSVLKEQGFPMKGRWHSDYFHNDNPVILELGCGKGEYTVGLASRFPDKNFIGIDIKGARMWSGACQVRDRKMGNAAFLRTSIELLPYFFAPGEVDEIWITFPDPQMKKVNKRLTARFCILIQALWPVIIRCRFLPTHAICMAIRRASTIFSAYALFTSSSGLTAG